MTRLFVEQPLALPGSAKKTIDTMPGGAATCSVKCGFSNYQIRVCFEFYPGLRHKFVRYRTLSTDPTHGDRVLERLKAYIAQFLLWSAELQGSGLGK